MPKQITDQEFDDGLLKIIATATPAELISIPGIVEILGEHYCNDVLTAWENDDDAPSIPELKLPVFIVEDNEFYCVQNVPGEVVVIFLNDDGEHDGSVVSGSRFVRDFPVTPEFMTGLGIHVPGLNDKDF